MKNQTDSFRVLIVLAVSTFALAVFVSYRAAPPPLDLQDLYGWRGYGAVTPGVIGDRLWYVWLVFTLLGLFGSFLFVKPARYILLVPLLLNPLRAGLGGIWVSAPLEDAFWAFHQVFITFVIGMAFFCEPVVLRFVRDLAVQPNDAKSS